MHVLARTRFILIPGLSFRNYVFLTADEAEDEEAETNRQRKYKAILKIGLE